MSKVLEWKNVVLVFPMSLLQKFKLNNEWLNGAVAGVEAGPSNQSRHQFHLNTFKLFRGDWWPCQSFITELYTQTTWHNPALAFKMSTEPVGRQYYQKDLVSHSITWVFHFGVKLRLKLQVFCGYSARHEWNPFYFSLLSYVSVARLQSTNVERNSSHLSFFLPCCS